MDHGDHVRLLREGVAQPGGVWGDFGAGRGAFTLALAELIGPEAEIHAVDRDAAALRECVRALGGRFPRVALHPHTGDFTRPLDLPPLDGLVIANALHFVRDKAAALRLIKMYLKPGSPLLVVEYNADHGNPWVPHPFSFETWRTLAHGAGFTHTELLATRPSRFLREIYSTRSWE